MADKKRDYGYKPSAPPPKPQPERRPTGGDERGYKPTAPPPREPDKKRD